jgi:hypothetical protein
VAAVISGLFADGLEVSRTCNDEKGEHQQKFDRHDEVEGVNQMKEAVGPVRKDMAIISCFRSLQCVGCVALISGTRVQRSRYHTAVSLYASPEARRAKA